MNRKEIHTFMKGEEGKERRVAKHAKREAIKKKMEGVKTSIGKVLRLHKGKE